MESSELNRGDLLRDSPIQNKLILKELKCSLADDGIECEALLNGVGEV
jgi:hypothetical protein